MHIENPLGYNRKMKEIKNAKLKDDKANFLPGVPPKYKLISEKDFDTEYKFYTLLRPNRYVMFNIQRACLGVKDPKHLFFVEKKPEKVRG